MENSLSRIFSKLGFAGTLSKQHPAPARPPICLSVPEWLERHPEIEKVRIRDRETYLRRAPNTVETRVSPNFLKNLNVNLPEFFVASIPGAVVRSWRGVIMLPDGSYPSEIAYYGESYFLEEMGYVTPPPITRELMVGDYFLVPNIWWMNYGHWLVDALLRLFLAMPHLPPNVKYIVPTKLKAQHQESLSALGVRAEQLEPIKSSESWRVERLWYAPPATMTGAHPRGVARALAARLMDGMSIQPRQRKRRIYISRRELATRHFVNEEEVEKCLQRHGFETVLPRSMSWRDEVALFSEADVLVENTGAGLTNVIFSEGAAVTLDIIDPKYMNYYHWSLAESLNTPYWYFFARTVPRSESTLPDVYVPIPKLEKTLAAIFK
jgi:capsular polysaccharide biosynthesis protein